MKENVWEELIQTVRKLRAPGGCPWDRAQTHQTLRPYLIEEAYEVLDVIDQIHTPEDLKQEPVRLAFREELGDLLMQVLIHSAITAENQAFDVHDVARELNAKLIRRHPHVFGDEKATTADEALLNWEKQKAKEKKESVLSGMPKGLPSLQKASRMIEKVSKVGFQWKDLQGPTEKLKEELQELESEITAYQNEIETEKKEAFKARISAELGDVLFSLCNIAHFFKINPEDSLREMLQRFESRFRFVESSLKTQGKTPEQSSLEEMDRLWNEAKRKPKIIGLTGGIASGKSTAARFFASSGIPVVDADQIAREISAPGGEAHAQLLSEFGTADRGELRKMIFTDAKLRQKLEAILHPLIQKKSLEKISALASPVVLYEAALLVETGRYRQMDGLIVIDAPQDERVKRLIARDRITQELAEKMILSQTSDEARLQAATLKISNSNSLEILEKEVKKVALHLKTLYKSDSGH